MADLLPKVKLSAAESEGKSIQMKPWCVTNIFSWLQCFGTNVSVLGPVYPTAILEMMAYMNLIICCSQDYEGLAWVRYNMAFQWQEATSGNKRWSEVNSTLYATCFTGKSQDHQWCELCLAKSHRTEECLLQGHNETELTPRQNQGQYRPPPTQGDWLEYRCGDNFHLQAKFANYEMKTDVDTPGAGTCTYVCSVEATIPE